MGTDLAAQASGIGALAEPLRRDLYTHVVAQPEPVGREEAAAALGIAVHTAKFHLDRLVEEGLLDVEYRRLTGRSGPGAGRPAKLYKRSEREFSVTLPERRYDLVGHILATAVSRAEEGEALPAALSAAAHDEGVRLGDGASAGERATEAADLDALGDVLATQGYEPRTEGDALLLANCPFHSLAKSHTHLVCGLNQSYVQGVADGLGCAGARACLEPTPGRCCVTVRPSHDSAHVAGR